MENYIVKIRQYRISKNLTQKELAAMTGISQSFLSEIENGRYDIKLSLLCRIAEQLEVSPFKLVELMNFIEIK